MGSAVQAFCTRLSPLHTAIVFQFAQGIPYKHDSDDGSVNGDVEGGGRDLGGPPTDELIPIYRRDSHLEVYCGSHQYPGCGVYIFKFDNSFSLWRSKWLYYRVYYGK
ncbi:unnamed protein product [Schistocephalus solidus]|uniref:GOLD domain-containing protein n=1 Tax=Schistocephalus solidus TaxID=70667 RepID=A0A183TRI9_SCHSO|nr:unnamed protein product [Schistocephalus solidus]